MIELVLAILSTAVLYLGISVRCLNRSLSAQLRINDQIIESIKAQNRINADIVEYVKTRSP